MAEPRTTIDLFVVSTEAEYDSVVDDGSGYAVTAKEVRLTGLPRFDRLLRKARTVKPERDEPRDRRADVAQLARPAARRADRRSTASASRSGSPSTSSGGLRSSPHPRSRRRSGGAAGAWGSCPTRTSSTSSPSSTCPTTWSGSPSPATDVQALYARAGLLVTDYSSVAFNAAYLDRGVVYYQFDGERDARRAATWAGRATSTTSETGSGRWRGAASTPSRRSSRRSSAARAPAEPYLDRIAATFPQRDGGACERVVAAIEELSLPWTPPGRRHA